MELKQAAEKYWKPVVLVLALTGAIWAFIYFRKPNNKIKFSFDAGGLGALLPNLSSRSSSPNAKGFGFYLDVPMNMLIKNTGIKQTMLSNIAGNFSYEGETIFQTKPDSAALAKVDVKSKAKTPVNDTFQVLINGKTVKFIKDYLAGSKPKVNYNLRADMNGKPYEFKDTTVFGGGSFAEAPATGSGSNAGGTNNTGGTGTGTSTGTNGTGGRG